jgi:hypothetical protein
MSDEVKLHRIDLTCSPEQIRDYCERNDNWVVCLDAEMTSDDLAALYKRQVSISRPYEGLIAEIAGDPRTPRTVLEEILVRFRHSHEVMGSLATNETLADELVLALAEHEHPIVREHAGLLIQKRRTRGTRT